MLKKSVLLVFVLGFSALVSADCAQSCQEKFDECMRMSRSTAKEKICGEILHDCKLACATDE